MIPQPTASQLVRAVHAFLLDQVRPAMSDPQLAEGIRLAAAVLHNAAQRIELTAASLQQESDEIQELARTVAEALPDSRQRIDAALRQGELVDDPHQEAEALLCLVIDEVYANGSRELISLVTDQLGRQVDREILVMGDAFSPYTDAEANRCLVRDPS